MAKSVKARKKSRKGWWIVGAGIAVVLLSGTIIVPRFRSMISHAHQGSNKGHLGALKSAISIYYGDHEGIWPPRLDDPDFMATYLTDGLPTIHLEHRGHEPSNAVETYPFLGPDGDIDPSLLRDTGHWLYDAASGTLILDCTHKSDKGLPIHRTGFES